MRIVCLILMCTSGQAWAGSGDATPFSFMDGDIVFQESRSRQSAAISAATGSRYTHMGLVVMKGQRPYVLEAVNPVRIIPYSRWRKHGADGHVVVKRLKDRAPIKAKTNRQRMRTIGQQQLGKAYDLVFAWDQERMYCSELVYRIYLDGAGVALGRIQRFADMNLDSPLVKHLARKRLGQRLDPLEPIITPVSIMEDEQLQTVAIF